MQYSHPMHFDCSMTTAPSSYLTIASTGQTAAQMGNSQCMQLFRPQTDDCPSRMGGSMVSQVVYPMVYELPRGSSFQSLHASTQRRHPMQLAASKRMARGLPSRSCAVG